jgi:hypothetical protein
MALRRITFSFFKLTYDHVRREQISRLLEQIHFHMQEAGLLRCHLQSIYVNVME